VDLDGVVWLTGTLIDGVPEGLAKLVEEGRFLLFCTNNASLTTEALDKRFSSAGLDPSSYVVITAGDAAASMLEEGSRALVVGERGLVQALERGGIEVLPGWEGLTPFEAFLQAGKIAKAEGSPAKAEGHSATEGASASDAGQATQVDAVVASYDRSFTFAKLARAALAIRAGARFIGTNEDPTHPSPLGLLPGTGAILAAIEVAAGKPPEVAGKPHPPMAKLIRQVLEERGLHAELLVGDRPMTDGALSMSLSVPFALVHSGAAGGGDRAGWPEALEVAIEAADLGALVADWFA
jgi:glycerol 3-phosphatase-2